MKNKKFILFALVFAFAIVSCKQLQELTNLTKCDFRLKTVDNIQLAGVNVQNIKNVNQISIIDVAKLTTAFLSKNLPLSFNLNVEARNPNPKQAAMTALDWILLIDDIEMTRGIINQRYAVPANGGITTIPMNMNFNLFQVLNGRAKDAMINFSLNLSGQGNAPTRIALKAKPTIMLGNYPLQYPGYITVRNTFTSK